jgi:hypothetical protein
MIKFIFTDRKFIHLTHIILKFFKIFIDYFILKNLSDFFYSQILNYFQIF